MEATFHFAFELVKIFILSCIYATIICLLFIIIAFFKPKSYFGIASKNKWKLWLISGKILSIVLFIFMFTYWGNHGLGDEARIPIGHFKIVNSTDDSIDYIEGKGFDQLEINNFIIDHSNLFAETSNAFREVEGKYIKWDLSTGELTFYKTLNDYIRVAKLKSYPIPSEFKDFGYQYHKYWNGWRFWLLP